jgi:hypothetical protein
MGGPSFSEFRRPRAFFDPPRTIQDRIGTRNSTFCTCRARTRRKGKSGPTLSCFYDKAAHSLSGHVIFVEEERICTSCRRCRRCDTFVVAGHSRLARGATRASQLAQTRNAIFHYRCHFSSQNSLLLVFCVRSPAGIVVCLVSFDAVSEAGAGVTVTFVRMHEFDLLRTLALVMENFHLHRVVPAFATLSGACGRLRRL